MIQLFLKTAQISVQEWNKAYQRICAIAEHFPLPLMRLESYDGYSPKLDKVHLDVYENKGTAEESLSFYGDFWSYTSGNIVKFYKNWEQQKEHTTSLTEYHDSKSITWNLPIRFENDGTVPFANAQHLGEQRYFSTHGAMYQYAFLAIGTMLENLLPGRIFMTFLGGVEESANIEQVVTWLEGHFKEEFKEPIFFDKPRLIASFLKDYDDPKFAAHRLQHLHGRQYFRCMKLALEHIGYESTSQCYAEVLSTTWFGTFGFSDVLNPWIAAHQDLESALHLIAESKRLIIEQGDPEKQVKKYDLTRILKDWLHSYILWTPEQREALEFLPNNKAALDTGSEDLFGIMRRMAGLQVNICPIVATEKELFEAFMFHDPKNGAVFKQIIEDWVEDNKDTYRIFKEKLDEALLEMSEKEDTAEEEEIAEEKIIELEETAQSLYDYVDTFAPHEQFFIQEALARNPFFIKVEEVIEKFYQDIKALLDKEEDFYPKAIVSSAETLDNFKKKILRRFKERRRYVQAAADFEQWVQEEMDKSILFHIYLLLGLKVYQNNQSYARFRILHDKKYWETWRTGNAFAVEVE